MTDQNLSRTKRSSQAIDNFSFDEDFLVKVAELVRRNADGTALEFFNPATEETLAGLLATKLDDVSTSNITYVGKAAIGSSGASAVWRIMKIDESGTPTTLSITWADGNSNFDNVWDNRTSLTYS